MLRNILPGSIHLLGFDIDMGWLALTAGMMLTWGYRVGTNTRGAYIHGFYIVCSM